MPDALYAVILRAPELPPFMDTARALARAKKSPVLDQTASAKRAWGILGEHLSEADAQALARGLTDAGLACEAFREDRFVALPDASPMTRLDAFVPERLTLIGAASVPFTTSTTAQVKEGPSAGHKVLNAVILMSTGLPVHIGGKERVVEKTTTQSDRLFYMDLVLRDPFERRRIDARQFDYSCLNERKTVQGFGNFRLLLGDFIRQSPNARFNHGARVLQNNRSILEMDYASLADFERELRWILTRAQ